MTAAIPAAIDRFQLQRATDWCDRGATTCPYYAVGGAGQPLWFAAGTPLDPQGQPDPNVLRREAASVGLLDVTQRDLDYRRLFPSLDLGVYCASHGTGKPSLAMALAIEEHLSEGLVHGAGAWLEGGWLEVVDAFREAVAALVGGDLHRGDVLWYPNFSESMGALLPSLHGRLVTTD